MLLKGMSIEDVVEISDLPQKEVEKLSKGKGVKKPTGVERIKFVVLK